MLTLKAGITKDIFFSACGTVTVDSIEIIVTRIDLLWGEQKLCNLLQTQNWGLRSNTFQQWMRKENTSSTCEKCHTRTIKKLVLTFKQTLGTEAANRQVF